MILSRDHTYIRLAALPDPVIKRFLEEDYPGLVNEMGQPLSVDDVKRIEDFFAEVLPGKEDLTTQWFLASVLSRGEGNLAYLRAYREMVRWYFENQKNPLFRQVVQEHSEKMKRQINPKNLMDLTGHDLSNVFELYYEREKEAKINKFPEELPKGSRPFYDDGAYQIVEVDAVDAACELGLGTRWCTKDPKDAEKYLDEDPLYVIYRNKEKFAQLHMGRGWDEWTGVQLMNLKNKAMAPDEALRQVLIKSGLMESILNTLAESGGPEKQFVRFVGDKANPRIRAICARASVLVILYAKYVLHGRFLEGERLVAIEDPELAIKYAEDIIKGRFPAAEDEIADQGYDTEYANMLMRVNLEQYSEYMKAYHERGQEREESGVA